MALLPFSVVHDDGELLVNYRCTKHLRNQFGASKKQMVYYVISKTKCIQLTYSHLQTNHFYLDL